jgi:hypothetical protein
MQRIELDVSDLKSRGEGGSKGRLACPAAPDDNNSPRGILRLYVRTQVHQCARRSVSLVSIGKLLMPYRHSDRSGHQSS